MSATILYNERPPYASAAEAETVVERPAADAEADTELTAEA